MGIEFIPMPVEQRNRLKEALKRNVERDEPINVGRGTEFTEEVTDAEVVSQIRSVPTHY